MTYKFTVADVEYEIPSLADMPAGALRKARHATDEMDKAFTILEATLGEDSPALAALDTLSLTELGEWLQGWTQGASLGEPSSSDN